MRRAHPTIVKGLWAVEPWMVRSVAQIYALDEKAADGSAPAPRLCCGKRTCSGARYEAEPHGVERAA